MDQLSGKVNKSNKEEITKTTAKQPKFSEWEISLLVHATQI